MMPNLSFMFDSVRGLKTLPKMIQTNIFAPENIWMEHGWNPAFFTNRNASQTCEKSPPSWSTTSASILQSLKEKRRGCAMLFRIFVYGAALFTCLGPCDFVAGGISGKRCLIDKILRGLQEAAPAIVNEI